MVKCDNCSNDASYTSADPGVNPVNYCTECLPYWLQERALAGHFPLGVPTDEKANKKNKKETVEPDPVEEPVEPAPVEEVPAEAPDSENS